MESVPKAKQKRRAEGVSERTLRRRKQQAERNFPAPLKDPSDSSSSSESDCVELAVYRLFQDDGDDSSSKCVEVEAAVRSFQDDGDDSSSKCVEVQQDSDVAPACHSNSDISENEVTDSVFCGTVVPDCEKCLQCSCIVREECKHIETGDCIHCDRCKFYRCVEEDDDGFYSDDDGEVLSPDEVRNRGIKDDFKDIVFNRQLSRIAVDDLLAFFRKWEFGNFPKSSKTLLDTPVITPTRPVPPGEYWHAGIESPLIDFAKKTQCDEVKVTVSCDGVPLAKSSNSSFWPILCSFNNSPDVVLAGAYHGYHKPEDSNVYLKDLNEEMRRLCSEGLIVDGKSITVTFHCLCCDAPAKAFILKIKGHNGYFSCPKCIQEGEMDGRRMCFPEVNAALRTDDSFRSHTQKEHHLGVADIQDIPTFEPVSCVPYDYMHLSLLGNMKKLMYLWLQGPLKVRLRGQLAVMLSDLLVSTMMWKPREFVRKLRQLQFIKRFKATEYRQILFYVGPAVFEPVLSKDIYEHFLVLHVAMTLLAHPSFAYTHVDYAEELLKFWVLSFKSLYGAAYVSHNVHGTIHLPADVRRYGPIDNFSAFKFENFLQFIIKLVRKGDKPLQQLARRYTELSSFTKKQRDVPNAGTFSARHVDGPLVAGCANPQFSKFQMAENIQLDCSSQANNCCVMDDGSVVVVKNFACSTTSKEMVVIGKKFLSVRDLYSYPIPSSTLGIFYVSDLSPLRSWPKNCVSNKLYRMPYKAGFAVVPLLHAEKGSRC